MIGNHLWNSIRVKNFVKGLGKKPTKWDENIAFLAECAGITVEKFLKTDAISFGIMIWGYDGANGPSHVIRHFMGDRPYFECMQHNSIMAHYKAYEAVAATIKSEVATIIKAVVAEDAPIQVPTEWSCSQCCAKWRTA